MRLRNAGNFTPDSLKHIFEGQINFRGQAVGYHYEGLPGTAGHTVLGTACHPNTYGVYQAKVTVRGVPKLANGGYSTFFPKSMTPQQVVDSINEAYNNRSNVTGNICVGQTTSPILTPSGIILAGMIIEMYLDSSGKIISAFPHL